MRQRIARLVWKRALALVVITTAACSGRGTDPASPGARTNITVFDGARLIVGDGSPVPLRARAKSSCFCNLSVVPALAVGCLVADIPAIVGSIDIVMGEVDR